MVGFWFVFSFNKTARISFLIRKTGLLYHIKIRKIYINTATNYFAEAGD